MPSAFTHIFVAGALGKTATAGKMPMKFWALSALCSILPDFDIAGFYFGIRYNDMFGHRGFFHSLSFALVLGFLVVNLAFREVPRFSKKWWTFVGYFFAVTASHGFLDALTSGGYGTGFFIPFDNTRYFLPWRIVKVSPISVSAFFSYRGLSILMNEFVWIWMPVMLVYAVVSAFRKKRSNVSS